MSKRFFISHASPEKSLAVALKEQLDDDAWVDLHEIDVGDLLLDEISTGIEDASDFVLLWSETSSESKWVRFELHMAFIRWLEDNAVAIRVICMDDTKVPLYLRPFLQARGKKDPGEIAAVLSGSALTAKTRRVFFNRNAQVAQIEEALYDSQRAALFICGMPGSGKRTLAKEALNRLTMGVGTTKRITVSPGTDEPELNLLAANALGLQPADENASPSEVIAHTSGMLTTFMTNGGVWVFEDAEHWLNDDSTLGPICRHIIDAASSLESRFSRLVVFTSRRKPHLKDSESEVEAFFLAGLSRQYAIPLLRSQGATGSDDELATVAEDLDGHPLALEVVAPRLPMQAVALRAQRHAIATDLVDPANLTSATWSLLEVLALVDGPIPGENLADALQLTASELQESIAEGVQYSLVSNSDEGTLSLHPLLRDYFLRSFRKRSDHTQRTSALADVMRSLLQLLAPGDALYVATLLASVKLLGLAGRFEEARSLRRNLMGTLRQTAVELYQEKRYEEALLYIDEALSGWDEFDSALLQLRMKTLAYLGRITEARALGDKLITDHATNAAVIRDRGRVEFIARNWTAAISLFEQAVPFRHNPAQLWADIAQARMRMKDWNGAVVAAQAAIARSGDTPWTLALHSEALEHLGRLPEAEQVMQKAVSREPNNPAYRHRLGRIALQTGHRDLALEQFRRSVEVDSGFVQSWLSLASILADLGDFPGAQSALASARALPGVPTAVADNVQAKLFLISGQLSAAEDAIQVALTGRRDGQNLALAVRILIARGEIGEVAFGEARSQIRALSRELDTLGELRYVADYSREFPRYF
ncbi:TIR domain-containing protein [Frigoribacterium sp. 2355]